tara:strand:+ start:558 stop:941 length:384 start_codon:yes stop_codon:yes gene_type:complete
MVNHNATRAEINKTKGLVNALKTSTQIFFEKHLKIVLKHQQQGTAPMSSILRTEKNVLKRKYNEANNAFEKAEIYIESYELFSHNSDKTTKLKQMKKNMKEIGEIFKKVQDYRYTADNAEKNLRRMM